MIQDTNQTGPYDPQGPDGYRYRSQQPQGAADSPSAGPEDPTHIWGDGIGLSGEDRTGGSSGASGAPTGYAAAGRPTGQASPRQSYAPASPEQPYDNRPQPYPSPGYADRAQPGQGYPGSPYAGQGYDQSAQSYPDSGYAGRGYDQSRSGPGYLSGYPGQAQSYADHAYPGQAQDYPTQITGAQPSGQAPGGQAYGEPAFGQSAPSDAVGGPYASVSADPHAEDSQPLSFLQSRGFGRTTDATPGEKKAPSESPFSGLRDLSFAEPVAPQVTKHLYVLLIVVGVLAWISTTVSGFSAGGAAGLTALVVGGVAVAAWILLVRIVLEVALSVIRLGADAREIRTRLAATEQSDETSDDEPAAAAEETSDDADAPSTTTA